MSEEPNKLADEIEKIGVVAGQVTIHNMYVGRSPDLTEEAKEVSCKSSDSLSCSTPERLTTDVPLASVLYVERKQDLRGYRSITSAPLIRIESPGGRWGKSSLLIRLLNHAKTKLKYCSARVSLDMADEDDLKDPAKFFKWFCNKVIRELRGKLIIDKDVNEFWEEEEVSDREKCTKYFEEHLLGKNKLVDDSILVLGLEKAGILYRNFEVSQDLETAEQFFSMLRQWHDLAAFSAPWRKIRVIISRSTAIPIPMPRRQSPFNVGTVIRLEEFNENEILNLAKKYGLDWSKDQVDRLMKFVGGQPYLLQTVFYRISSEDLALNNLLAGDIEEPFLDHIYLNSLYEQLEDLNLKKVFHEIIRDDSPKVLNSDCKEKLYEMGLIKTLKTSEKYVKSRPVIPFCDLYRKYFIDGN